MSAVSGRRINAFVFALGLSLAVAAPSFAQSRVVERATEPPKILTQDESTGFTECGFECGYSHANAAYSQKTIYLDEKRSQMKRTLEELRTIGGDDSEEGRARRSVLRGSLAQSLRGHCVAGEESSDGGIETCFARFQASTAGELRKIRGTMLSHSDTIRQLRDGKGMATIRLEPPVKTLKVQAPEVRTIKKMQKDYRAEREFLNQSLSEDYKRFVEQMAFKPVKTDFALWKSDPTLKEDDVEYRLEVARDCQGVKLAPGAKCVCEKEICYDDAAYRKSLAKYETETKRFEEDRKRLIERAETEPHVLPPELSEGTTGSDSWSALLVSRQAVVDSVNRLIDGKPWKEKNDKGKTTGRVEDGQTRKVAEIRPENVKTDELPSAWTPDGGRREGFHVRLSQERLDQIALDRIASE